jgi:fatty acid desaturase
MSDTHAEQRRLREEIQAVGDELWNELNRGSWWHFSFGPIKVQRRVESGFITRVYVAFNAVCFTAGVVLVFFGDIAASVGVALIVGALFSFGAFVSQFWAVVAQQEHELIKELEGDDRLARLRELRKKQVELSGRLNGLIRPNSGESADAE